MDRPRCVTFNLASVDGRLTVAPGVSLMAGDPRWPTAGMGDPYDWVRSEHDPEVLLEGSGSFAPDPEPGAGHDLDRRRWTTAGRSPARTGAGMRPRGAPSALPAS